MPGSHRECKVAVVQDLFRCPADGIPVLRPSGASGKLQPTEMVIVVQPNFFVYTYMPHANRNGSGMIWDLYLPVLNAYGYY